VLAESTLARRSNDPETHGRRPPVLQHSRGPIQLSLFDNLEQRTRPIDASDADSIPGALAVEPLCESSRPAD
jgi:hypothetical protein